MEIQIHKKIDTDLFFVFVMIASAMAGFIFMVSKFSKLEYESISMFYFGVNLLILLITWIFGEEK
jgi:hypothetical protein